jgi:hypothetical protein
MARCAAPSTTRRACGIGRCRAAVRDQVGPNVTPDKLLEAGLKWFQAANEHVTAPRVTDVEQLWVA